MRTWSFFVDCFITIDAHCTFVIFALSFIYAVIYLIQRHSLFNGSCILLLQLAIIKHNLSLNEVY